MSETQRIETTSSCGDSEYIPKVDNAGIVIEGSDGRKIQLMHNGIKVFADAYYGPYNTTIVENLRGHHEPQEEKVFFEVLKKIAPGSTMIELGAYWSYYSLWFQKSIRDARNFMVEPELQNLVVGQRNFELNDATGAFEQAIVGDRVDESTTPAHITVDYLIEKYSIEKVAILHSDIQGFERQMLDGASNALRKKNIQFIFISTHSNEIHQRCRSHLKALEYHIVAEHTLLESFSADGLIVASAHKEFDRPVVISYRSPLDARLHDRIRFSLYRMGVYGVLSTIFTARYPGVLQKILR